MLNQLLEIALLGTEKKSIDLEMLPQDIRDFMSSRHEADPQLKFLEVVSLSNYYQEAGKSLLKFSGIVDDGVVEEVKPLAPEPLLNLFAKLEVADHSIKEYLFNLWLNVLISRENILSPEYIIKVLNAGNNFAKQTKGKITEVIGNKGTWILSYSDLLNYKVPVGQLHVWEEGNHQQRKNLFLGWREHDLEESIKKLQESWNHESIVNKKSFLEIIEETSAITDLVFLESLYETEFRFQPKEKKTEKECRRIIVITLLKYPESKLYKSTTQQLSKYFNKSKKGIVGFVTGKQNVSFVLPEKDDAFWNAQHIEEVYGFETKNIDIAIYNHVSQFWLAIFIEALPISFWIHQFDDDHTRMLNYFLEDELNKTKIGGNTLSIYLQSFLSHAKSHRDEKLAGILIDNMVAKEAVALLQIMRKEDYEAYVIKNKYFGDVEVLSNGPFDNDHSWSLQFSQQVIAHAYEMTCQNALHFMLGHVIAKFVHHDADKELIRLNDKARDTNTFQVWNKNVFEPVHTTLEIRSLIETYKN